MLKLLWVYLWHFEAYLLFNFLGGLKSNSPHNCHQLSWSSWTLGKPYLHCSAGPGVCETSLLLSVCFPALGLAFGGRDSVVLWSDSSPCMWGVDWCEFWWLFREFSMYTFSFCGIIVCLCFCILLWSLCEPHRAAESPWRLCQRLFQPHLMWTDLHQDENGVQSRLMVAPGFPGADGKRSVTLKRSSSLGVPRASPRENLFFEDYPGDFSHKSHWQTVKLVWSWFVSSGMPLARMCPQPLLMVLSWMQLRNDLQLLCSVWHPVTEVWPLGFSRWASTPPHLTFPEC